MNKIKVFAPATISNVGAGYDIFGLALQHIGDTIELAWRSDGNIVIDPIPDFPDIPLDPNKNIAGIVAQKILQDQKEKRGVHISICKNILPGSGLGSSGSSAAGVAFGINQLLNQPYTEQQVVEWAMLGEAALAGKAHADNVAPAVMGGFVMIKSYEPLSIFKLPYPNAIHVVVVHPQVEVKTAEARKLLPKEISLENHTKQAGCVAGMIAGMLTANFDWIKESMEDLISEPNRAKLIPAFYEAKNLAYENGAIACSISGSGPSIFAFATNPATALQISNCWQQFYEQQGVIAKTYTSLINGEGCKIIHS